MRAAGLDNALQNRCCLAERAKKEFSCSLQGPKEKVGMAEEEREMKIQGFPGSIRTIADPGTTLFCSLPWSPRRRGGAGITRPWSCLNPSKSCLYPGNFPMLIMFPSLECNR